MPETKLLYQLSLLGCRGLMALTAATVCGIVAVKTVRGALERYAARREAQFLPALNGTLTVSQPGVPPRLPRVLPGDAWILERLLLDMRKTAGPAGVEKLSGLYESEGFAESAGRELGGSRRWWARARAARRLGTMLARGQKAVLVAALDDPEVEVRLMAAWALGEMKDLQALQPIFKALAGFSKIAALRVSNIVLGFGAEAVPAVVRLLAVPDPVVQLLAIQMLGELSDPRARAALLPFLAAEDKELRVAASVALGRIGDAEAARRLRAALADPEWPVTAKAAEALGRLGDEGAVPLLLELLSHREWWVRLHAGEALARLGAAGRRALEAAAATAADRFARDMAAQWIDELDHAPTPV